jgi:hypothetical protein
LYFNTSDLIQKYINTDNGASRDNNRDYFNPQTGNTVKLISTVLPSNKLLWSPRLGFNWDITGDKTIQVRGGTGIFTGKLPFVWLGIKLVELTMVFKLWIRISNGRKFGERV